MRAHPHNDGQHIRHVIDSTSCDRHHASNGEACWDVYISAAQKTAPAVCNYRIKRAGYDGRISPSSLSRWVGGRGTKSDKTDVKKTFNKRSPNGSQRPADAR
jgi:hypothetical protein